MTDVFLTHDWGTDENGRSNHARVSVINAALKQRGYVTWFDEEKMEGNIVSAMCEGIENTRVVVVFVTKNYMEKLAGHNEADNCKMEFGYAANKRTGAFMLPIVMEKRMKTPKLWIGPLGFTLGGVLAVRMFFDFSDETKFFEGIEDMARQINMKLAKAGAAIPYTPKEVAVPPKLVTEPPVTKKLVTSSTSDATSPLDKTASHILYAMLSGAAECVFIKKFAGHGEGKCLGMRKKSGKLDLMTKGYNDKDNRLMTWTIKPMKLQGLSGFSIAASFRKEGQDNYFSMFPESVSDAVVLCEPSKEVEMDDFWAIIPEAGNSKKTFKILSQKKGKLLTADWTKKGYYSVECSTDNTTATGKDDLLWEIEGIGWTTRYNGLEDYSSVFANAIVQDKAVTIRLHSLGHASGHLNEDPNCEGKVGMFARSGKWFLDPWRENGKTYTFISWNFHRKYLTFGEDGARIRESKGNPPSEDGKWELIPMPQNPEKTSVYNIRFCSGENNDQYLTTSDAGVKLDKLGEANVTTSWLITVI